MHVRLRNELILRLARRALAIASAGDDQKGASFQEFCQAFREEYGRFEEESERMKKRLQGLPDESKLG
jgi:hypothetical protein